MALTREESHSVIEKNNVLLIRTRDTETEKQTDTQICIFVGRVDRGKDS